VCQTWHWQYGKVFRSQTRQRYWQNLKKPKIYLQTFQLTQESRKIRELNAGPHTTQVSNIIVWTLHFGSSRVRISTTDAGKPLSGVLQAATSVLIDSDMYYYLQLLCAHCASGFVRVLHTLRFPFNSQSDHVCHSRVYSLTPSEAPSPISAHLHPKSRNDFIFQFGTRVGLFWLRPALESTSFSLVGSFCMATMATGMDQLSFPTKCRDF
jgi:hypothetical protein